MPWQAPIMESDPEASDDVGFGFFSDLAARCLEAVLQTRINRQIGA